MRIWVTLHKHNRIIARTDANSPLEDPASALMECLEQVYKDLDLAGEESLIQEINSGRHKVIIGDPLIEELIYKESQVKLISLPHVALSSKLYWKHAPELLGNDMDEIVHKVMQGNSSAHAQSPC